MTALSAPAGRVAPRQTSFLVWWNVSFFTLLCVSETGFMAAAVDWALAGILHLPTPFIIALSVVLTAGVAWCGVTAFRRSLAAERELDRLR